jgi:hypothetical protein
LLIRRLPMFPELQAIVKAFLVYDMGHFARKHATNMCLVFSAIVRALSRRNGFGGIEHPNTLNEHWIFATEDYALALQSVSCHRCGNYLLTSHMELLGDMSHHALCHCDRYIFEPAP